MTTPTTEAGDIATLAARVLEICTPELMACSREQLAAAFRVAGVAVDEAVGAQLAATARANLTFNTRKR